MTEIQVQLRIADSAISSGIRNQSVFVPNIGVGQFNDTIFYGKSRIDGIDSSTFGSFLQAGIYGTEVGSSTAVTY